MYNKEKVIQALKYCIEMGQCRQCPYYGRGECTSLMAEDALKLIEDYEAIIEKYKTADNFLYVHGWRWESK